MLCYITVKLTKLIYLNGVNAKACQNMILSKMLRYFVLKRTIHLNDWNINFFFIIN